MNKINYTISPKEENQSIGCIVYSNTGESIEYYSEKKLLDDYKESINYMGFMGAKYKIYVTQKNPRHGLRYALINFQISEFGQEYTKEEYESEFINNNKEILEK